MQTSEMLLKWGRGQILVNPWLTKRSFFLSTQIKRGSTDFWSKWLQAQAELLKNKSSRGLRPTGRRAFLTGKGSSVKRSRADPAMTAAREGATVNKGGWLCAVSLWSDTTWAVTPLQPRIPGSPSPCFLSHLVTQAVTWERPRLASQLCGSLTNYTALGLSFFKGKVEAVNVHIISYFIPTPFLLSTPKITDQNLKLKLKETGSIPGL